MSRPSRCRPVWQMSSATEPDQFSQKTALIRLRSHSRRSENVVHGCRLPNGSYLQNNIARSAPLIGLGLHRVGFDRAIRRMSRPSPLQVANVLAKKPISGRRHGTRGRQIVPRRGRIRDPLRRRTAITHAARPFRSGRTEAASRQCPGSHRPPRGFVGPLRPTAPVARSVAPPRRRLHVGLSRPARDLAMIGCDVSGHDEHVLWIDDLVERHHRMRVRWPLLRRDRPATGLARWSAAPRGTRHFSGDTEIYQLFLWNHHRKSGAFHVHAAQFRSEIGTARRPVPVGHRMRSPDPKAGMRATLHVLP